MNQASAALDALTLVSCHYTKLLVMQQWASFLFSMHNNYIELYYTTLELLFSYSATLSVKVELIQTSTLLSLSTSIL